MSAEPKSFVVLSSDRSKQSFMGEFRTEVEAQIRMARLCMNMADDLMESGICSQAVLQSPDCT